MTQDEIKTLVAKLSTVGSVKRIAYGVTKPGAKVGHLLTGDGMTALCGYEAAALVPGLKDLILHKDCVTVASALTEGNDSETMATPSKTSEGETMAETKKRSADEIKADIDSALEAIETADSEEKVTALADQITEDLKGLRGAPKQQRAMQLKEAAAKAMDRLSKPSEILSAADWREMEGADEVFAAAVERIREGAKLGTEAVKLYDEICNVLFEGRLRLKYKGLPDLQAKGRAAKQLSIDAFEEAKKGIDEENVDLLDFHKALRKGVTNRMGDKVVTWLRALDESTDREVFESTFPMLDAVPDTVRPSAAIRDLYSDRLGVELPTQTRAEQMAIQRAERKALEAKKEAGEELGREELKALGEAVEPTPAEKVVVSVGKVNAAAKAVKPISAEDVAALDEDQRKAFKAQLEADISAMREVYALFV